MTVHSCHLQQGHCTGRRQVQLLAFYVINLSGLIFLKPLRIFMNEFNQLSNLLIQKISTDASCMTVTCFGYYMCVPVLIGLIPAQ